MSIEIEKGLRPEAREIDPCGIDKEGNRCLLVAFDKERGIFWGVPEKPEEEGNGVSLQGTLYENGQNRVIFFA